MDLNPSSPLPVYGRNKDLTTLSKTVEPPVRRREARQGLIETTHYFYGEFDPGSGRTLAACLTHASGATNQGLPWGKAANG